MSKQVITERREDVAPLATPLLQQKKAQVLHGKKLSLCLLDAHNVQTRHIFAWNISKLTTPTELFIGTSELVKLF